MNFNINGFVDIYGQQINHHINGVVDIVNSSMATYTLYENNKTYLVKNPDNISFKLKKYQLLNQDEKLAGIKLQFINGFIESDKSVLTRTINDECNTDINGYYYPIIENGNYSVNIIGGKYSRLIHNQYFETNIVDNFYLDIEGLIKERNGGTLTIYNSDYKLIVGKIVNQNNVSMPFEIIVSKDDKVFAKYITNEDGKYRFALKHGIYDVRIKSDKYFKLLKNINFTENDDFVNLISGDNNEY